MCPDTYEDWIENSEFCYKVLKGTKGINPAKTGCNNKLVTFQTQEMLHYIGQTAHSRIGYSNSRGVWSGFEKKSGMHFFICLTEFHCSYIFVMAQKLIIKCKYL